MFGEDVEKHVEAAVQRSIDAVADTYPGGIDDLLLLELLLDAPDDHALRALGSRARVIAKCVAQRRGEERDAEQTTRLPAAEDLVHFAAGEAIELGGYGSPIGTVHVLLALFAFQGARSEAILRECGIEWRALRSVTRRLGVRW